LSRPDSLIRTRTRSKTLSNPKTSGSENYLMQGVTTVVTGNDGDGPFRVAKHLKNGSDKASEQTPRCWSVTAQFAAK
jgi:hypothetical protein